MTAESKSENQVVELKESGNGDLLKLLANALGKSRHSKESPANAPEVMAAYETFREWRRFNVGETVKWKPGLKNRRLPLYEEAAVVIEVLSTPVVDTESDSGSPNFREPLDIVLGVIDDDGDFLAYHFDGRRFQKY